MDPIAKIGILLQSLLNKALKLDEEIQQGWVSQGQNRSRSEKEVNGGKGKKSPRWPWIETFKS